MNHCRGHGCSREGGNQWAKRRLQQPDDNIKGAAAANLAQCSLRVDLKGKTVDAISRQDDISKIKLKNLLYHTENGSGFEPVGEVVGQRQSYPPSWIWFIYRVCVREPKGLKVETQVEASRNFSNSWSETGFAGPARRPFHQSWPKARLIKPTWKASNDTHTHEGGWDDNTGQSSGRLNGRVNVNLKMTIPARLDIVTRNKRIEKLALSTPLSLSLSLPYFFFSGMLFELLIGWAPVNWNRIKSCAFLVGSVLFWFICVDQMDDIKKKVSQTEEKGVNRWRHHLFQVPSITRTRSRARLCVLPNESTKNKLYRSLGSI